MAILTPRVLRALERFNAAYPWDHNAHYHPWILRQLPRRFGRGLDVGCGSGELVRLLARRAGVVRGVDRDAGIVARARELTPVGAGVEFVVGEALEVLEGREGHEGDDGAYDVVTCVATLHHLPLGDALRQLRAQLAPGGTLVVVGLARAETRGDHLLGALAVPLNVALGWLKNKGRPAPRPVAMTAPTRPAETGFAEVVREARRVLPGARLRRRVFWRYTLVWRRV
ncbi:class I SAM-dependent methyltransferase [Streptomyces sp. NBC_00249]|uniref:class I SAM-dependent methyltransferase n=1 Tax=Streptomyces sp. NBC_00249 TaxID=2975690 RepID=UPI002257794A|nr:class I SAM-dependent methyltransferase [Streptomyces sp. NBC_00249]MCX5195816.1 class I SAM-dependent methyltransferase [Streptomyces sp. NBC_00249]